MQDITEAELATTPSYLRKLTISELNEYVNKLNDALVMPSGSNAKPHVTKADAERIIGEVNRSKLVLLLLMTLKKVTSLTVNGEVAYQVRV